MRLAALLGLVDAPAGRENALGEPDQRPVAAGALTMGVCMTMPVVTAVEHAGRLHRRRAVRTGFVDPRDETVAPDPARSPPRRGMESARCRGALRLSIRMLRPDGACLNARCIFCKVLAKRCRLHQNDADRHKLSHGYATLTAVSEGCAPQALDVSQRKTQGTHFPDQPPGALRRAARLGKQAPETAPSRSPQIPRKSVDLLDLHGTSGPRIRDRDSNAPESYPEPRRPFAPVPPLPAAAQAARPPGVNLATRRIGLGQFRRSFVLGISACAYEADP
jgi:hypothetical protein